MRIFKRSQEYIAETATMLKRFAIRGYKSFHEVDLRLRPLVVLIGPNAAGKSNFLDALQLLSRMVSSRTLKEAFDPPYRGKPLESFTLGNGGLEELLAKDAATFIIEADIELSQRVVDSVNRQIRELRRSRPGESNGSPSEKSLATVTERFLRYRIEVEILPQSGILRVADEYLAALNEKGQPTGKRRAFLERINDKIHLRMEGQAHPTYFERNLDHTILSKPLYAPHYPHLTAFREEVSNWTFFYFEPRERMRASTPVKEVRHIGLMGEELASFLNTLKATNEKQFRAIESALSLIIPSISRIEVRPNVVGEVELSFIESGRPVSARIVSEGTLRVLGLLAIGSSSEHPSLIGFEEPENGVHPRRIRLIAERLKSHVRSGASQFIVTTHSTVLADLMPTDSLFVCRKLDGQTEIRPYDDDFPLGKHLEIADAMDDEDIAVSTRILRGDLDA